MSRTLKFHTGRQTTTVLLLCAILGMFARPVHLVSPLKLVYDALLSLRELISIEILFHSLFLGGNKKRIE